MRAHEKIITFRKAFSYLDFFETTRQQSLVPFSTVDAAVATTVTMTPASPRKNKSMPVVGLSATIAREQSVLFI